MIGIMRITEKDKEEITTVLVDAVMMPNGELIRLGKTIGWVKDMPDHIFKEVEKPKDVQT